MSKLATKSKLNILTYLSVYNSLILQVVHGACASHTTELQLGSLTGGIINPMHPSISSQTGSYLGGISLVNLLSSSLGLPQNSIGINPQQGMDSRLELCNNQITDLSIACEAQQTELQRQISSLQLQHFSCQQTLHPYQNGQTTQIYELSELSQKENLQQKIMEKEKIINNLNMEIQKLKKEIQEARLTASLTENASINMEEWDKLQAQLSHYKQLNFESDKTIKDLVEELDAITLQMETNALQFSQSSSLQKQLDSCNDKLEILDKQKYNLKAEITKLKANLNAMKSKYDHCKHELDTTKGELKDARELITSLREDIEELKLKLEPSNNHVTDNKNSCPSSSGWSTYKNAVYKYFHDEKTWMDAEKYCNKQGSGVHLVSIQTSDENHMVSKLAHGEQFWTGGHRNAGGHRPWSGMWRWSDGSPFVYTNWHHHEPNNAGRQDELFINIGFHNKLTWNDHPNGERLSFVCKCSQ